MVPHLPFLTALAEHSEGDPEWCSVFAGYLVLRFFDNWLQVGPARMAMDSGVEQIRAAISVLPDEYAAERRLATEILDQLLHAPAASPRLVAPQWLAYAHELELRGRWTLAAHIYNTVALALSQVEGTPYADTTSIGFARWRQGACLRNAKDYEGSRAAYKKAIATTRKTKDRNIRLYAKLGLVNIVRARGNLSAAETKLNELLTEAAKYGPTVQPALAKILHSRGSVRHARGQYQEALVDLYRAFQMSRDNLEKELMLTDLGVCAGDGGYRTIARDALSIIVLSTTDNLARQIAIVNLMEIAILDGDRSAFERRRLEWNPRLANPTINAYAHLYIARGIEHFGKRSEAIAALRRVAEEAEQAGIHQVQFEALKDLERLEHETGSESKANPGKPDLLPDEIHNIGDALSNMKALLVAKHN